MKSNRDVAPTYPSALDSALGSLAYSDNAMNHYTAVGEMWGARLRRVKYSGHAFGVLFYGGGRLLRFARNMTM